MAVPRQWANFHIDMVTQIMKCHPCVIDRAHMAVVCGAGLAAIVQPYFRHLGSLRSTASRPWMQLASTIAVELFRIQEGGAMTSNLSPLATSCHPTGNY
jgi:hypothetical protein